MRGKQPLHLIIHRGVHMRRIEFDKILRPPLSRDMREQRCIGGHAHHVGIALATGQERGLAECRLPRVRALFGLRLAGKIAVG